MAAAKRVRAVVLVKVAPVLTSDLDETMCVAGAARTDNGVEWIRLHPVPFRDLASESRFTKYQEVEVNVIRSATDRRPESWTPVAGAIALGTTLGTQNGWADRREVVAGLREATMCDLVDANRGGSGPQTPSLSVVRPVAPPTLIITKRDDEQLSKWRHRAAGAKNKMSLFDDASTAKPDFEVVPWRFQYQYRCARAGCKSHTQTIVDWEAVALWRKVRRRVEWKELMRAKFEDEMWLGRASSLFVGNQEQYPGSFLVLGVFWPPEGVYQPRLEP